MGIESPSDFDGNDGSPFGNRSRQRPYFSKILAQILNLLGGTKHAYYLSVRGKVCLRKSDGRVVAPGNYWTAINVHNPMYETVKFRKKVAIAFPREKPGPISQFFDARLGPDEAFEIDREDIFEHAPLKEDLLKDSQ
jgi:hypothetical protein